MMGDIIIEIHHGFGEISNFWTGEGLLGREQELFKRFTKTIDEES